MWQHDIWFLWMNRQHDRIKDNVVPIAIEKAKSKMFPIFLIIFEQSQVNIFMDFFRPFYLHTCP